jgi:tRNA wybutosine-synthesizing protein 1
MLSSEARNELEKQQYRIVGEHSAVKVCGWTKNMLRGRGGCYKLKFYGIQSHQCLQMTTSLSCANRCVFCWRGYKAPVSKEWTGGSDDPKLILDDALRAQEKLLTGFKGNDETTKELYEQSRTVRHVALSLTGEPITYPRLNELIRIFHTRGISTFLVTNAQYSEQLRALSPVTQLYLSLDAPDKELLKDVDKPLFSDFWERLNESLEILAKRRERTCIRLTAIKGVNMMDAEGYAALIRKGDPDFVEVKSYMHVGASQQRLEAGNMPLHEEVVAFARELAALLSEYELASEHIPSRVVLLAKKKYFSSNKWRTWIDFEKFFELAKSGEDISEELYRKETPRSCVGISGKGTPTKEEAKMQKQRREKAKTLRRT